MRWRLSWQKECLKSSMLEASVKFTLGRSAIESEKIPGVENVTSEDVVLAL